MGSFGPGEIIILFIMLFGILLLPLILYLLTLQKTLNLVRPENRHMEPGLVWLALIPIFSIIWNFFIVSKVAESLRLEFKQRNIQTQEEKPGYTIGLAYCILFCCTIIPVLGLLTSIAGLVCWIIYWVKISGYKAELEASR
jgi:hypothetical protein